MIDRHAEYFEAWLDTFPEELFVILTVYSDESYNDDALTLCGFIATPDYWRRFRRRWNAVLNDFGAPHFHFREFADKDNKDKIPNNPFLSVSWNAEKRDLFLNELAIVLSEQAVPVGSVFDNATYLKQAMEFDSRELAIAQFYIHFQQQLNAHWPGFDGQVLFVFDETDNQEWIDPLNKVHKKVQAADRRVGGLSFENDKRCPPLQGADLYAYINRQLTEKYYKQDKTKQAKRHLDWILSKNAFPKFKKVHSKDSWERLVRLILAHRQQMRSIWAKNGDRKRAYIPEVDFRDEAQRLGFPLINADEL